MSGNDFNMDTNLQSRKVYLDKMKIVLRLAILLTGVLSFGGITFIVAAIWSIMTGNFSFINEMGAATFARFGIFYLSIGCAFVALIKIIRGRNPFSKTLTNCIKTIGMLFTVSSLLIPRLSGFVSSGFDILSYQSFVLIDGGLLTFGLLFIILSSLIKVGFEIQQEVNEIL